MQSTLSAFRQILLFFPVNIRVMFGVIKSAWKRDCQAPLLCVEHLFIWGPHSSFIIARTWRNKQNLNRRRLMLSITTLFLSLNSKTQVTVRPQFGLVMESLSKMIFFTFSIKFLTHTRAKNKLNSSSIPTAHKTNTLIGHRGGSLTTPRLSKNKVISCQGCFCQTTVKTC